MFTEGGIEINWVAEGLNPNSASEKQSDPVSSYFTTTAGFCFRSLSFTLLFPLSAAGITRMRSVLSLFAWHLVAATPTLAATAGSFADGGSTLVSAMMVSCG